MSPEQGKRYVIPSIEEEVEALDHASYHYDGKEALVHLDNVLGIQGIEVIQWVPGCLLYTSSIERSGLVG